ncbi:DUF2087 domain-containing protein [Tateyamaria omphalii]|uniref:DUF2087 domain-containing protein n=1 Tax=Tateyamaria omphalii TaxID=299262 RepID=UPI001E34993F|nr:DUF2087 domain-containing protein [Tateyamaria omphalii]
MTLFARSLSSQLGVDSPSHLVVMNMIARAAGFENFQHMRAASAAKKRMLNRPEDRVSDARAVERTLHQFDVRGRLRQWPSRRGVQTLALWALWATLPAQTLMEERTVNDFLFDEHLFNDPATLRRTMISCGLLTRKQDGTDYLRVEQQPSAEAIAVIRVLGSRRRTRSRPSALAEVKR